MRSSFRAWNDTDFVIVMSWWKVANMSSLILSCMAIMALCVAVHWVKYLIHQQNSKIEHNKGDIMLICYIRWGLRTANYALGTLLMLTSMTYHPLILLSLGLGVFLGDYLFYAKSKAIYTVKSSWFITCFCIVDLFSTFLIRYFCVMLYLMNIRLMYCDCYADVLM